MTFKHLLPAPRNQATRRQTSCLAVDPGRCEFWRVQKNSAWGHLHLHNPPDIFPCNLIKLFTSLAPNYVDPTIHSPSISSLWAVIVSNQPMSLVPSDWPADAANKAWLCLTHKDFKQTILPTPPPPCPLCLAFLIVLGFYLHLKNRADQEWENFITGSTQSQYNGTMRSNNAFKGS